MHHSQLALAPCGGIPCHSLIDQRCEPGWPMLRLVAETEAVPSGRAGASVAKPPCSTPGDPPNRPGAPGPEPILPGRAGADRRRRKGIVVTPSGFVTAASSHAKSTMLLGTVQRKKLTHVGQTGHPLMFECSSFVVPVWLRHGGEQAIGSLSSTLVRGGSARALAARRGCKSRS